MHPFPPPGDPTEGSSPPYPARGSVHVTASFQAGHRLVTGPAIRSLTSFAGYRSAVPNEPRLSRRRALQTAAALSGVVVLAGCDDDPGGSGTPGAAKNSKSGRPAEETPSTDPVVVAALSTAAAQVTQLSLRYAGVSQKFPALRTRLAAGSKYHASHLARLKETAGVQPPAPGKLPALPSASSAALADLAKRETSAAVAHAAAAAKVSGEAARLLAMIAAAETQLAATLSPKKKADSE